MFVADEAELPLPPFPPLPPPVLLSRTAVFGTSWMPSPSAREAAGRHRARRAAAAQANATVLARVLRVMLSPYEMKLDECVTARGRTRIRALLRQLSNANSGLFR